MEYHLLWEIPAAILMLIGTYYCALHSDGSSIIEEETEPIEEPDYEWMNDVNRGR